MPPDTVIGDEIITIVDQNTDSISFEVVVDDDLDITLTVNIDPADIGRFKDRYQYVPDGYVAEQTEHEG